MNIFVTYRCPRRSARVLDDKRVNKMILESAQMLGTALREHNAPLGAIPKTKSGTPMKPAYVNHPCTVWARQTRNNYRWLLRHLTALCEEKRRRFGTPHFYESRLEDFAQAMKYIPEGRRTRWANCSPYKDEPDIHLAYRKTMIDKWDADTLRPRWFKKTYEANYPVPFN